MTTFPKPEPAIEPAEHPRGTVGWIHANPSPALVAGKPPIDALPNVVSKGGASGVTGKQPDEPGLPEMPTADNTRGGSK
jgi:hypothetical protein